MDSTEFRLRPGSENRTSSIWKAVVRAVDRVGDAAAESIRVQLWLKLRQAERRKRSSRLNRTLATLRELTYNGKRDIPAVDPGKLVFCFPSPTPSHLNNLRPCPSGKAA